ncbi:Uncharacterized protein ChrSV_4694 [Chromobacterium vaccinii]|nr:Uncharacterized protein ChrSW_4694 [Chromobacterium vaccinii]QND92150.1 Uncharacterized protein ChrSV_4694 [Chromobacterium vaccinii]
MSLDFALLSYEEELQFSGGWRLSGDKRRRLLLIRIILY